MMNLEQHADGAAPGALTSERLQHLPPDLLPAPASQPAR